MEPGRQNRRMWIKNASPVVVDSKHVRDDFLPVKARYSNDHLLRPCNRHNRNRSLQANRPEFIPRVQSIGYSVSSRRFQRWIKFKRDDKINAINRYPHLCGSIKRVRHFCFADDRHIKGGKYCSVSPLLILEYHSCDWIAKSLRVSTIHSLTEEQAFAES